MIDFIILVKNDAVAQFCLLRVGLWVSNYDIIMEDGLLVHVHPKHKNILYFYNNKSLAPLYDLI